MTERVGRSSLRHLSLKRKLIFVITATSALTLALAAVIMIFRDIVAFRSNLVDELSTIGEIVGANSTAALLFDDPVSASETLAVLEAAPQIVECLLFASDGRLFARYAREGWVSAIGVRMLSREGHRFDNANLRLVRAVRLDGERIGTLALTADLTRLYTRVRRDAVTVGLILILSITVALAIATAAQRFVSDPILELANLAKTITLDKSYSARAVRRSNDEVGLLTTSLNEMLDEIELRDGALREAHDALESHVRDLKKLSAAVEQSPATVMITDQRGDLEYVNKRFEDATGYPRSEVLGSKPYLLASSAEANGCSKEMRHAIRAGNRWHGEVHSQTKAGGLLWEQVTMTPLLQAGGAIANFLIVTEDVTVRKEYEARLLRQATVDPLTELPNRLLAFDRLTQAVEGCLRSDHGVAVMFIDIDNFKTVNDSLGHDVGDIVLCEAARRIEVSVRSGDTVARLGGDEFLVVLPRMKDESVAEHLARRIRSCISEPFDVKGREVFVTASIGIALAPGDASDPDSLLRNADAAMYQAKQRGRNNHLFFEHEMNEQVFRRLSLESNLRQALKESEFSVHYQPVVDIEESRIVGAEALLRWTSSDLGQVPPDEFIPVAEDTGMIVPLGEWVLRTACFDALAWQQASGHALSVAVNVSTRQFRHALFVDSVSRALADSGLPPACLELEVTESLLMRESPATTAALMELHELGVRLAIDDFGTGFSSLGYLKRFPFDILKIDRSFIRDVVTDDEDATLVGAIVAMGRSLDLKVVAEGAETQEQLDFLCSKGCRLMQGFLLGRPMPNEAFCRLTADPHRRTRSATRDKLRLLSSPSAAEG
jgi:diguanylate cyclase (GGDEF)-like protein/PAS domain S-box-containing protein